MINMEGGRIFPPTEQNIEIAADILKEGGLVAFPTETVYGLGANGLDGAACSLIYKAKGRPSDNPLILHISSVEMLEMLCCDIPKEAYSLTQKFWPGALTLVLKKSDIVPHIVSAGLDTVAVRMPSHPVALDLIRRAGLPIAAPSANISGRPSPTTALHVDGDFGEDLGFILEGGQCDVGLESTVLSLAVSPPRLLRPGGVTAEEIEEVIGSIDIDRAVLGEIEKGSIPSSPGMKYRHYAPKGELYLVEGDPSAVTDFMKAKKNAVLLCLESDAASFEGYNVITLGRDLGEAAHNIFAALRTADDIGATEIYCPVPKREGLGLALYNRLIKAAGHRVIRV